MTPDDVDIRELAREIGELNLDGPIQAFIDPYDAYVLLGTLQFAWRNPSLDDSQRQTIEGFARQLQEHLCDRGAGPLTKATMEMGWNPEFDRPREFSRNPEGRPRWGPGGSAGQ